MELKSPSLVHLIGEWISGDQLLVKHFSACEETHNSGFIYFDCGLSKPQPKGWVASKATVGYNSTAANVVDTKVTIMFHQHEFYKFHAAHPMFFQKLRGWLFDMHNRHGDSCSEYLR